ncbi:hypothetical protein, partial [Escherichia coli]|uniref:hypothetical protein n=1 Tax=Escherichia coli TaxID=562 RepID=UPI0025779CD4
IAHIGNVALAMQNGKIKYLLDVLHVPNITKNLLSVGQMIVSIAMQNGKMKYLSDVLYVPNITKN